MRNAARNAEIVPRGVFQIKKLPFYGSFYQSFLVKQMILFASEKPLLT